MRIKQALSVITRPLVILPLLSTVFLASTAIWGTAQEVKVKKTPITRSDSGSGKQMYIDYCAPCHGIAGKGDGPAAPALKTPPTNLSLLAKNNGGQYPADRFVNILQFRHVKPCTWKQRYAHLGRTLSLFKCVPRYRASGVSSSDSQAKRLCRDTSNEVSHL